MKIKITRKDGSAIIGKKKFCINEVDSNEWSISYNSDNGEIIEFIFSIESWRKTLDEVKAISWKNDVIEDEFDFIATTD